MPELDVSTPQLVKDHILHLAYARGDSKDLNFIYNGIRPADAGGKWDGPVSNCQYPPVVAKLAD